jgi:hypothetical protein
MSDLSALDSRSESNAPPLPLSEVAETRRCLAALVAAIEAGELEATAYLLGYLRGALATLESLES